MELGSLAGTVAPAIQALCESVQIAILASAWRLRQESPERLAVAKAAIPVLRHRAGRERPHRENVARYTNMKAWKPQVLAYFLDFFAFSPFAASPFRSASARFVSNSTVRLAPIPKALAVARA